MTVKDVGTKVASTWDIAATVCNAADANHVVTMILVPMSVIFENIRFIGTDQVKEDHGIS